MAQIFSYKKHDLTGNFQACIRNIEGFDFKIAHNEAKDRRLGLLVVEEDGKIIVSGWMGKGFTSLNQAKNAADKLAKKFKIETVFVD